jgi:hypothetical protein
MGRRWIDQNINEIKHESTNFSTVATLPGRCLAAWLPEIGSRPSMSSPPADFRFVVLSSVLLLSLVIVNVHSLT